MNDGSRRRLLTNDEIITIANDVRTRPIAEVGRHVMPLIHHVGALEDRECRNCAYWVGHNHAEPHEGECTVQIAGAPRVRLLTEAGERPEGGIHAALVTAFDWSCKGWTEQKTQTDEAQASL